jgi:hypothetical protein
MHALTEAGPANGLREMTKTRTPPGFETTDPKHVGSRPVSVFFEPDLRDTLPNCPASSRTAGQAHCLYERTTVHTPGRGHGHGARTCLLPRRAPRLRRLQHRRLRRPDQCERDLDDAAGQAQRHPNSDVESFDDSDFSSCTNPLGSSRSPASLKVWSSHEG